MRRRRQLVTYSDNHFVRSPGFYPTLLVRYLQEIATQPMLIVKMMKQSS
ncbi:hypothetical protein HanRHA438_Chr09g0380701 [Helianthus annuus]|nr:hypothetical protein HanRHA438_Chr09g0380701 [Helianthus annuus]